MSEIGPSARKGNLMVLCLFLIFVASLFDVVFLLFVVLLLLVFGHDLTQARDGSKIGDFEGDSDPASWAPKPHTNRRFRRGFRPS